MPFNPFKDLSPRKNTRIGDGYLKDATDETKQNSDKWKDHALANLRDTYTTAKDMGDDLHRRLDDSVGLPALTTVAKGINYRIQASEVSSQAAHLTTTTTGRPLAPRGSTTAEWQQLTSKQRLKVLNEDADFMTARHPDRQSIRTRATDGDSSQDHDDSEHSFVNIEGLPESAISRSRKQQASAASATHMTDNPPAQPTAHPNSSHDNVQLHEKRLVRKTEAGMFYDGPSATPNMQQPVDHSNLTSLQGAPQVTRAPQRAPTYASQVAPSQHAVPTSNSFGTRPPDQRVSPQGALLHHAPTYASQMPLSHRSVPNTNPAAVAPPSAQGFMSQDALLQRSPTNASHVRSPQRAPTYASQVPPTHQSIPQGLSPIGTSLEPSPTYASRAPSSRRFVAGPAPSGQAYTSPAPTSQRYGPTSFPVTNAPLPSSQPQTGTPFPNPSTGYMTSMSNTMGPPVADQNPSLTRSALTLPTMYSPPHQAMGLSTQGYPYTGASAYGQQYSVLQDPSANPQAQDGEAETRYAPFDARGNIPPVSWGTSDAYGGNSGAQGSNHRRPRYPAI